MVSDDPNEEESYQESLHTKNSKPNPFENNMKGSLSAEQKIFERDPSHIIPGQIEQDQDSLYQHFSQQEQLRDAFENQQREASINFQDQRKYLAEEDYSN